MPRPWIGLLVRIGVLLAAAVSSRFAGEARAQSLAAATPALMLHMSRSSPLDLELGGEITGIAPGTTRYVTRDDLLALPQVTYTVADDSNFKGATQVSGVSLEELTRHLGAAPLSEMVVAICNDQYRAHYPRAYVAAHHPLLVLNINGKPPSGWPKATEGHEIDMGPFLISHP